MLIASAMQILTRHSDAEERAITGRGVAMRILITVALGMCLVIGCVSQQQAKEDVRKAFDAGRQQGRKEAEIRLTQIIVRGPVRQPAVPWREGLTLAQAIVEAVYTAPQDPVAISITRGDRIIPVDPAELLRGVDPALELGDIVDIR